MKKFIGYFRLCDLITMLGTLFGVLGMVLTLNSHYTTAVFFLAICGLCDAFDGTVARMHDYDKTQKEYGVQLDSLSDVICFGVLPAVITCSIKSSILTIIISVFYVLCGVIRLAYFNTLHITGTDKKGIFIGVPITTIAIVYPLIFFIIRVLNFSLLRYVLPVVLLIIGLSFVLKIEIKKVNVPKLLGKIFNKYILFFGIYPLFIIFGGDIFYRFTALDINNIFSSMNVLFYRPYALLFTYLFVVLIISILLSLLKTSKKTKLVMFIITTLLFIINDIKFSIMGNPIEISDVNFLKPSAMKMMGEATTTIGSWIWLTIFKALLYGIISFGFVKLDKFSEIKVDKLKIRGFILGGSIILFSCLVLFTIKENDFVITKVYQTSKDELSKYIKVAEFSNNYGLIQGIILSGTNKIDNEPVGYSKETANEILLNASDTSSSLNWGKANVVFLLSESFSDLENIDEIKFNKSLMQEIRKFAKDDDKMVFDLVVPTFGGVSVNSEFELLTGASISFWTQGLIPYNVYYDSFTGKNAPNVIKEFKNNGYETMYLTPWGSDSYNSKKNYNLIGIDKTIYGIDLNGKKKGQYYADSDLMKDIFNELKSTSKGNYKFIMAATGQNHFPYYDKYDKTDIKITKSEYDKSANNILLNYAQGIYDASKELNNLYEMIKTLDTPTIIVFFGDHLPYTVDDAGSNPYLSSRYFNTENNELNLLRQYTTKAVILANYKLETEKIDMLNISYLGAYVLNNMDLNVSNYFKYVYKTSKELPVFNRLGTYQDGEFLPFSELGSEEVELINNYKYVQYRSFYDIY